MSSPAEDARLVPGTVVAGKLRIVRQLGIGGMGTVYEVEHELTKHRRALKILHSHIAQVPQVVARFLREASAAARIGNPHIAETFDAGRLESGEPYLLMELLEGETLDQRLLRLGPLDPGELAELIGQVCDGVQAAHDAGIVHRDLKPENLFVTSRGGAAFAKILDFGISKFDEVRTGALGVTAEGTVIGTPFYMPPEQVRGASSIDARADVYSLGVILYECACGVRPYDAQAIEHLAILIHEGKPLPLAERRPSLPPGFAAVVHRAMAVDRDQRYPTARALAEALESMRDGSVALRATVSSKPPSRVVIRPSSTPAIPRHASEVSATTGGAVTAALADTLGTVPPSGKAHRARAWAFVAAAAVVLGAGVTWTLARSSTVPATASPPAAPSIAPREERAPSVVLSPLPPPAASANTAQDAGGAPQPSLGAALVRPSGPSARPGNSLAPPAPSPTPKTRVDQNGLAGENPFR